MFFRAFPSLYYKVINDLDFGHEWEEMLKHVSVIGGDVHVENFSILPFKGTRKLRLNDFDDLTLAPTIYDPLRLLVSMKLAGQNVNEEFLEKFSKRYLDGLMGQESNYSRATQDLMDRAIDRPRISKKKIDSQLKKFLEKRRPSFDMTSEELHSWEKLISAYGELHDSYRYIKDRGGSAGLIRFELLVEDQSVLLWLEGKEWTVPAYERALEIPALPFKKKMGFISQYEHPEFIPTILEYDGRTYFLKEVNNSHVGIEIIDLENNEVEPVFLDEAYALGEFHKTFDVSKRYIQLISELKANSVLSAVDKIHKKFKELAPK